MIEFLESTRVPVGEHEIHLKYDARPEAKGRPVVLFLHGFPDALETWELQLAAMSDEYRVAAMDLRGTNRSTGPRGSASADAYYIPSMLTDLDAVIDFLGGPLHLVAHDWGALIAWVFAADSNRASSLLSLTALSCPHPAAAKIAFRRKLLGREGWRGLKDALEQMTRSWYILLFQIPLVPGLVMRLAGGLVWNIMLSWGDITRDDPLYTASPEYRRAAVRDFAPYYRGLMRGPDLKPAGPIQVPCRLLIPLWDMAITPSMYDAMPELGESIELVPQDANHWLHRERPEETTRLIREFIAAHSPAKTKR